ncbi:MAG: hypothetical protein J1E34_03330 [Oscillospiraceae bacterium]|nr:hypothetical protein [Oscillospiraceae bacterium]
MKKFIISLVLSSVLILSFVFPCFADTVTVYGSVTDTTSQVSILVNYYQNLDSFNPFNEYIVVRNGEYSWRLYYSDSVLNDSQVNYIEYSRTGSTGNYYYRFLSGRTSSRLTLSNSYNYTYVGNISGAIASTSFSQNQFYNTSFIILVSILILSLFSLFRIKIQSKGVTL